jgi:hypothetical protein
MNDKLQALQDDIAFLKALAEDGRAPPVLGGSIMVMAGVVFGLASICHWAIQTGRTPITTQWAYPILWMGAVAVFLAGLSVLRGRMSAGAVKTNAARASGVAWSGVGWTIFAMAISMVLVSIRTHSAIPMLLFPPLVMALYGLGWLVAAAVSKKRWITLTAIACYGLTGLLAWFAATSYVFLIYAAALLVVAIAPGLILMRTPATSA